MKKSQKKSILFVCTGNMCRSQMAEGFAREMLSDGWTVYSAGIVAAGMHPMAIEVMREAGIDISGQYSKTIDEVPAGEVDYVVTLCDSAKEQCPFFPRAAASEHWPIEDPIGRSDRVAAFRKCRDDIRGRVLKLAEKLKKSDG